MNNTYYVHEEALAKQLILVGQYMHTYREGISPDRNAQCADGPCHISMYGIPNTNIANGSRYLDSFHINEIIEQTPLRSFGSDLSTRYHFSPGINQTGILYQNSAADHIGSRVF